MTSSTRNEQMNLVEHNATCAQCDASMVRVDDPNRSDGMQIVRCSVDPGHKGYRLTGDALQAARQGQTSGYMANALEKRSPILAGFKVQVILERLLAKWEKLDLPQAAMFLNQCETLGLDPFMGEIAALAFKDNKTGNVTMQPMITEKGWALLAQETEPDEFLGPPGLEAVTDEAELKRRRADDPDDIVIIAKGRKRSWPEGHYSEVVSTLRAEEWQGSRIESVKKDPYHHAEIRAERRWYEQTYPAAGKRVRDAHEAAPREDLKVIIEGTFKELPADGEPQAIASAGNGPAKVEGDVPRAKWLEYCPEHGDKWLPPGRNTTYGSSMWHRVQGASSCQQKKVVNDLVKSRLAAIRESIGMDESALNVWLKSEFDGNTLSRLSPEQQIDAMGRFEAYGKERAEDMRLAQVQEGTPVQETQAVDIEANEPAPTNDPFDDPNAPDVTEHDMGG